MSLKENRYNKNPSKRTSTVTTLQSQNPKGIEPYHEPQAFDYMSRCHWCSNIYRSRKQLKDCHICGGPIQELPKEKASRIENSKATEWSSSGEIQQLMISQEPYEQEI